MNFVQNYLDNVIFEFNRYKNYGDVTFAQLTSQELYWRPSVNDNSIAIIVNHMAGNMVSRWTNFLSEDGEKAFRHRDREFETPPTQVKALFSLWEQGWTTLFDALKELNSSNFDSQIKIRGEIHTIPEAVNRQLAHYSSHVGQIVYLGKMIKGADWQSLSIPKGQSETFNKKMFGKNS
ncbi:MAG: DUF1572 family protein [Bacteroidota bacterium]